MTFFTGAQNNAVKVPYSQIRLVKIDNDRNEELHLLFPAFEQAPFRWHNFFDSDYPTRFSHRLREELSLSGIPKTAVNFICYYFDVVLTAEFAVPEPWAVAQSWMQEHPSDEFVVDIGSMAQQQNATTYTEIYFTGIKTSVFE